MTPEQIKAGSAAVTQAVNDSFEHVVTHIAIVYHGNDFTLMMPTPSREAALAGVLQAQLTLAQVAFDIMRGKVTFDAPTVNISKLN